MGMQSLADQYADRALDDLPFPRYPPIRPPAARTNANAFYRSGLAAGADHAFRLATGYHGTVHIGTGAGQRRIAIAGPQLLRVLHRRYGVEVGAYFMRLANVELRRRYRQPWPVMPAHY
jgi:hypothetical protein